MANFEYHSIRIAYISAGSCCYFCFALASLQLLFESDLHSISHAFLTRIMILLLQQENGTSTPRMGCLTIEMHIRSICMWVVMTASAICFLQYVKESSTRTQIENCSQDTRLHDYQVYIHIYNINIGYKFEDLPVTQIELSWKRLSVLVLVLDLI